MHNAPRAILENMDELPFVTPVYKRDLKIENYFIGYLKHPYLSLYTGRGCKSRCTFCLWPQTVGGHRYRTRSVGHVVDEDRAGRRAAFPQVKEFFFDDDTFTDDLPRAEAIARELGKLGVTWSCNAKANVPRETLKVMRDNGLRLLLVGYEIGQSADSAQHQEGHADRGRAALHQGLPRARHHDPRHVHPRPAGRDARDDRGDHPLRAPRSTRTPSRCRSRRRIPARTLYRQALENGWLDESTPSSSTSSGVQIAPLHYPHLSHTEIFDSVETFYRRFYFRRSKIASIVGEMVRSPRDDEAPAARRRRILPIPARATGARALNAGGLGANRRHVIITADDFGAAVEVNEAVEIAHTSGVLTAASLLVGGAALDDAVARAGRLPNLRVGLHLVLVEGRPLLRPDLIPDLVNDAGTLRTDMAALGLAVALRGSVRAQLAAEITAQFEAFASTGLTLDHVNAHKHFHVHPGIASWIERSARASACARAGAV